ncbi:MAG: Hsp20/alpha crystallin family protein, partial [Cyanobacteria bacterium REEB65]|nr:Hsp20/alpha crystallin family protein [Cyanobacteria bacterium REEB65]
VVTAELPGLDIKDINVEIAENRIVLSGQTRRESEIREENYFRSERSFGSFQRSIALPDRVLEDQVTATFENGILTIRAPLLEPTERRAKKVPIEARASRRQLPGEGEAVGQRQPSQPPE